MTTRRLLTAVLATSAAAVLTAGCSAHHSSSDPSVSAEHIAHQTRPRHVDTTSPAGPSGTLIPTESPRPTTAVTSPGRPDPAISTPTIPDATTATGSPVAVAKAWAIASNSSSYHDPEPGTWTERAQAFVTGAEATAEAQQHHGGGGSTWVQIRARKCVTGLRQLAITIPSDAPTGPDRHVVYLTAISTLSCATGQVQLSQLAAQLIVARISGCWLVADVHR
ncbi:MAG: hypothetical protein JWR37_1070 [Mycobacterium sp.]|nr:hypothetical protein [Mycobacterium sp.]